VRSFYINSTLLILILSEVAMGLTLLNFIFTYSAPHAIIIAVSWIVMQLSARNLRLFIEGNPDEQDSNKP